MGADGWNNGGLHPRRVPAGTKVHLPKEALREELLGWGSSRCNSHTLQAGKQLQGRGGWIPQGAPQITPHLLKFSSGRASMSKPGVPGALPQWHVVFVPITAFQAEIQAWFAE